MIGGLLGGGDGGRAGRRRPAAAASAANVFELDQLRILRALVQRRRYKYVQPRVEREGAGWKIVSPNCSRNVDNGGGEIDIAWFVPDEGGGWLLHSRDHARGRWVLKGGGLTLAEALARVSADHEREYWQ